MPDAILDCSSLESAIDSLDRLLRLPHGQLRSELSSIDLAWMGAPVAPEDPLVQALGFRSERELPVPDGIRWFHVTRAPMSRRSRRAFFRLTRFFRDYGLSWGASSLNGARRRSGLNSRSRLPMAAGASPTSFIGRPGHPSGQARSHFLVRDAALGRCGDHKDFTRIPEVLEDIYGDYADLTGHPLHQAYEHATCPCVVEFTTRGGRYGAVRAALNYAHRTLRGFEHGVECNTCFTGKGQAVPRAWIDRIDWL